MVKGVERAAREDYSRVVVLARACGAGDPLPAEAVRAALFARASSMAWGGAGVLPVIVETQCAMLAGADAMARAGIATAELGEKESLALASANSISVGLGALLLVDLAALVDLWDRIAVLTMEAFRANPSPIDPRVVAARAAPGQTRSAASLRAKLAGSALFEPGQPRRIQDPISIRCASHVHGSVRTAMDFCVPNIEAELNGAGDNPLVVAEDDVILSNGNFHTHAMAVAFDTLALAKAQMAVMASQRTARLLQGTFTDLPDSLTERGPTHAGVGMLSLTAETLAKDIHILCQPASIHDSSGYNVEDHALMTPLAVRKAVTILGSLRQVAACELIVAAQAYDLRGPARAAPVAVALRDAVRAVVPRVDDDRSLTADLEAAVALVARGDLMPSLSATAAARP